MKKVMMQLGAVLALCLAADCGPPVPLVDSPYETCSSVDTCNGSTSCAPATLTTDGYTGYFCTAGCDPTSGVATCPPDGTGIDPVCVASANDPTNGQCYAGCPNNTGCPFSEACSTAGGGIFFCVP